MRNDPNIATRVRNVAERPIPVANLNITATSSGAAQTFVTAAADEMVQVDKLTVTNKSGTAATLTLHAVPSGGTIGDTNKELDAINVPANTTLRVDGLLGGLYAPETELQVYSGTNGALVIRAALTALK